MGNGDDTVLNTGTMANINLGSGNDTYTVGGFGGINEVVVVEDSDLFFPFGGDRDGGTGSAGGVRGGSGNDTMTGGTSDDKFLAVQMMIAFWAMAGATSSTVKTAMTPCLAALAMT